MDSGGRLDIIAAGVEVLRTRITCLAEGVRKGKIRLEVRSHWSHWLQHQHAWMFSVKPNKPNKSFMQDSIVQPTRKAGRALPSAD